MRAVTIKQAKARMNELVEAAERGEDVVILRGSRHVAAIVPITAEDLEIAPRLTDAQAQRFWGELAREQQAGRLQELAGAEAAVAHLARSAPRRRKRPRPR
jgi:prevent-host-death family protein